MSDHKTQHKIVPLDFGGTRQPIARIHVLGTMRATSSLGKDILPRGRKARAVLGYLCLNAGQRVGRSRLASLLWDRVPDQQARTSLRQALRELSAAMGSLARDLVSADVDTVRLDGRLCWIDAFAVLSSESLSPHSPRGDLASLCTGEILEDLSGTSAAFDQWLIAERTRFTSQLSTRLEAELQQLGDADPEARAALSRSVIAFDATHEGASRMLMRALADMGERGQAIREYERCRGALKANLDAEPSFETRALFQAIKAFQGNNDTGLTARSQPEVAKANRLATGLSRLRVGVVPLQTGGSSVAESLGFSLSREIAGGLARFRWFDVIAVSSATLDGATGARTPLHYTVEGDVLADGERLRISVRLLDVSDDPRVVWSDHFELASTALDELTESVVALAVARIDPVIRFIEGQQPRLQRSGATSLVLQAIPLMYSMHRENYQKAGELIAQAIEMDPVNATAAAWGAYWQVWNAGQGWADDVQRTFATAQELALRAIKLDPENAEAMGIYAHICAFLDKDFDSALHYFDRALRLNPNLAFIWALSAPTYCYIGEPDEALKRLARYRGLAPFDPYFGYWEVLYTIAHTFKGEYEQAVSVGRRNVAANPELSNAYKPLIAAFGHLGRRDEAVPYVQKLLTLEPSFTAQSFAQAYPFRRPEDRERYVKGLVLAGIPAA